MNRIGNIIQDAIEFNVRSCSASINLFKDYVQGMVNIIRSGGTTDEDLREPEPMGPRVEPRQKAPPRPPLMLAAELGEDAGAAFILNNPTASTLDLVLSVHGDLGPQDVQLLPAALTLRAGEQALIRLKVTITQKFTEDRDYLGHVFAPGVASQVIGFVVRRLRPPHAASEPRPQGDPKEIP